VWELIASGRAYFFPLPNAAVILEINRARTQLRSCHWWLAGGDLDEIVAFQPQVEAFARAHGCTRITISGRRGWLKAFTGFREDGIRMSKEL
jgi:hypothetical protein